MYKQSSFTPIRKIPDANDTAPAAVISVNKRNTPTTKSG